MKRVRQKIGSLVIDKRIRKWNFIWWENAHRRSRVVGSTRDYPTKASAWKAGKRFTEVLEKPTSNSSTVPTMENLVQQYRVEKMPQRAATRRGYGSWLQNQNHILPRGW
jgi:hypothetical protein